MILDQDVRFTDTVASYNALLPVNLRKTSPFLLVPFYKQLPSQPWAKCPHAVPPLPLQHVRLVEVCCFLAGCSLAGRSCDQERHLVLACIFKLARGSFWLVDKDISFNGKQSLAAFSVQLVINLGVLEMFSLVLRQEKGRN